MNELANFTPPYSTVAYSVPPIPLLGTGIPYGLISNDVYDSNLWHAPVNLVQMLSHALSTSHRINSTSYAPNNAKLMEDSVNMMKTKLGVETGNLRLYKKPYSTKFDLVSYPLVGIFLIL